MEKHVSTQNDTFLVGSLSNLVTIVILRISMSICKLNLVRSKTRSGRHNIENLVITLEVVNVCHVFIKLGQYVYLDDN